MKMSSSTATALIAAVVSIAVSAALAVYLDTFLFFLFVPFVPFVFGDGEENTETEVRECPVCGFRTQKDRYSYCPHDGEKLRSRTVYQD